MWEGSYASEPFDLRLTVLRMVRNLGGIVLVTLLGTLLFGGGYYVKNVLLGRQPNYESTITCKLEYTNPPVQSGDYYINEMTWNTYLDSAEFLLMVEGSAPFAYMDVTVDMWTGCPGGVAGALSAAVASDIHVPSFTVSTPMREKTETLCQVVQKVLTEDFAAGIPEVASIKVIDVSGPELVKPDVRPLRAVILSAVLSCFFAVIFVLLREIGADSIWLPAILRRRYGLKTLGTIKSIGCKENICYLFENKTKVAVCPVNDGINPQDVTKSLQEILQSEAQGREHEIQHEVPVQENYQDIGQIEWLAVPTPLLSPETAETLREADGVLLVVEAGLHAGRHLEYVLEFLTAQDISVTAALLWNADETLLRCYYLLDACGQKTMRDGDRA